MWLTFGPVSIDTKGLPALSSVYVAEVAGPGPMVLVLLLLDDKGGRRAVEKWARRLGVEVRDQISTLYDGDPTPREFCAVVEADGFRVKVYIRAAAEAPGISGGVS
jgi:hypothetical protein